MPLSDYEQRVLGEIERELVADQKLASRLDSRAYRKTTVGRRIKGAILFTFGLTLMLIAILMPPAVVGFVAILGFGAMFTASIYAFVGFGSLAGNRSRWL